MGRDDHKIYIMAIKLKIEYPGRTIVNAGNPNGTFKNSVPPGSLNGTPGHFAWAQDMWSFFEILMSIGGVTHNDAPDDADDSQRFDALTNIARDVWPEWDATHTYSQGAFTIGSDADWYQSLVPANVGNDPTSSPTDWRNVIESLDDLTRDAPREWDSVYDYGIGTLVLGSDGKIYKGLVTPNVGNDPTTPSPAQWREFIIDDVVSTFSDVALSANQGKLLQDQITAAAAPATKTTIGLSFLRDQRIILANSAGDPSNDFDFSGGLFTFDDGTGEAIAPIYTKQLDAGWAAGDNVGGLDPASTLVATGPFSIYAIYNPISGLSDYVYTDTLGVVTVPGYTKKRYIGSFNRLLGANLPIRQIDKYFYYEIELPIFSGSTTLLAQTIPVGTPSLIPSIALLNVNSKYTSPLTVETGYIRFFTPGFVDNVPTVSNSQITVQRDANNFQNIPKNSFEVLTDGAGQINFRGAPLGGPAFGGNQTDIGIRGWIDINLED